MADESLSLLHLLQLADSSFPTGSFAQSFGLETLSRQGWLAADANVEVSIERLFNARLALDLARVDLPLLRAAYEAAVRDDSDYLCSLDTLARAARPVREWREASARTGRRLLTTVSDFAPSPLLDALLREAPVQANGLQQPIAFAVAARVLGCPIEATALAYVSSQVQAGLAVLLRLGILGQAAVQRLIHRMKPAMPRAVIASADVGLDAIGGSIPLLEIAGMCHEFGEERLFAS